jgi:seryl-tRNA synthetase
MHDIRWIRENAAAFDAGLKRRGLEPQSGTVLALDDARKAAIAASQNAQEKRNALSKQIGMAMGQKDIAKADALKAEVAALKEKGPELEAAEKAAIKALEDVLAAIPNLPHDDVPDGADEHGNVEYRRHGEMPEEAGGRLHHAANVLKEHFELGEALGQMDFETAAKLSGSRFVVLNRGIARLSRALGQFMLDLHTAPESEGGHGYREVNPPLLVRDDAMFGTAQLPKFRDDQFYAFRQNTLDERIQRAQQLVRNEHAQKLRDRGISDVVCGITGIGKIDAATGMLIAKPEEEKVQDDFWLIPTAEVPLTNLVRESILDHLDGNPQRYTALTPCFRAEAGSAGRDTRGMLRQHQFEKVELVSITTPDESRDEHERMVACAETVLKKLELHFRTMTLCTGDMGFASRKTYDIEVWLPGQKAYREISSCSVCGDFQARRMNARFRPAGSGAAQFVHTLNGSGVAVGRALIAVMENYQNPDGSITVPQVLQPYMGGLTRIEKAA